MNIKKELETKAGPAGNMHLNNIDLDPLTIKAVMINEVVPADPLQDFYGIPEADYLKTTIPLFQGAGTGVTSIQDILQLGIYITNAVKTPKTEYAIDRSSIENSLPYLEAELSLFPNTKVIMLMGDVARKAFNMIAKKATGKNAIPARAAGSRFVRERMLSHSLPPARAFFPHNPIMIIVMGYGGLPPC